jgi:hypothetical protein
MEDEARFHVRPPLRCAQMVEESGSSVCARAASWERCPVGARAALFYCDEHRGKDDRPIAAETRFLRVSLVVQVDFTGCHLTTAMAQGEALAQLERAVDQAGGHLSIVSASSVPGRLHAPAERRAPAGSGARV